MCLLFIEVPQKHSHSRTRQELGFVNYKYTLSAMAGKRKGSQLADFKHAQFTSRAFGFIPVQFDQSLLPSQQIPYVLADKQ